MDQNPHEDLDEALEETEEILRNEETMRVIVLGIGELEAGEWIPWEEAKRLLELDHE